jgi:hypothetical protein
MTTLQYVISMNGSLLDGLLVSPEKGRREVSMEIFDVVKKGGQWKIMKEGSERALRSFDRKQEAVSFGRDYVRGHGGQLRIWSADGTTLQQEHTYPGAEAEAFGAEKVRREPEAAELPESSLFEAVTKGARDAAEVAGRVLPALREYLNKGIHGTSYYAAYGVVLAAVVIGRSIPLPASVARGLHEGSEAAIDTCEKGHSGAPRATAAATG